MDSIYNLQKKLSSPELVSMQKTLNTVHAQLKPYYDNVEYMSGFQNLAGEMNSLFANMIETSGFLEAQSSLAALGDQLKNIFTSYMFNEEALSAIRLMSGEQYQIKSDIIQTLGHAFDNYSILHINPDNISEEEIADNEEANDKIISEIFQPDESLDKQDENKSSIITLSPINDKVLEYLSQNPRAFYQLEDRDFEFVMAEIYRKLGYKVETTQQTRDGGKDLIIRKPEILGDFIYYVECKKYAAERHIGVGIVRNLVGTVSTDRVNGGILATTSFFTKNACKYVLDNKLDCQIKMHDYNTIRNLLNQVV